jgi:hypothetical protein
MLSGAFYPLDLYNSTYQALPKFMAPRHRGLTLTAPVGESIRYRPKGLFGDGAIGKADWKLLIFPV